MDDRPLEVARIGPGHTRALVEYDQPRQGDPFEFESGGPNLLHYVRILLRHRYVILVCLVAALAAGAAITYLSTPIFTAHTTLQIDREAAKVVNSQDDVTPSDRLVSAEEFFQTQYGLLKSRSLAIRVAETLRLADSDEFLKSMGKHPEPGATPASRRNQVLKLLASNLDVSPVRGSRLVVLGFDSPSPRVSANIANAFAEGFIGANLDRRFESSSYARDFLEKRLAQVKVKLEQSERDLGAYARSNAIINLPQQGTTPAGGGQSSLTATDLVALDSALSAAKADRIRAEQRWKLAKATPGLGLPDILASPTIQDLSRERAKLQGDYQNKIGIYKPDYPEMLQLKGSITEVDRQIAAEAANIRASLQAQYTAALNNENALQAQVNGLKGDMLDLGSRGIQYNFLQREVDTNRALYDGLLQRYKEIGVAGGITTNNISVVDRAEPPIFPSKPRPALNLAIAGLAGLALGIALAFLLEAFDQALRTPADVEEKVGIPVLGSVPVLEPGITPREALNDTRSNMSEAFHSIRSALQFSTPDGLPRSLVLTSAKPSEGKSTTAFAIAQSAARLGVRTLLIDSDLRNPSLHKVVGADNSRGLSSYLTGALPLSDIIQPTEWPALFVIACGPVPPNPAELLASHRLRAFCTEASAQFDLLVFDSPPIMGLADAPMLSSMMEGTIMVVEANGTGRGQSRAALKRLFSARARVLGAVLNKFDSRQTSYGYGYGYAYEYAYDYAQLPKPSKKTMFSRVKRMFGR